MNKNNRKQSTEHDKFTEENSIQDLKESLEDIIEETKDTLDELEQTVETIIKDKSMSDATKKIVASIGSEIKNSIAEESQKNINTTKAINNSEEE